MSAQDLPQTTPLEASNNDAHINDTKKRPREDDQKDALEPSEKRLKTPENNAAPLAKPAAKSLLARLKNKVTAIDNVIKSAPEVQPTPAPITVPAIAQPVASPLTASEKTPKHRASKKKASKKQKKPNDEYDPSDEEDVENDERPKRSRRPAKTYVDYDSDPSTKALPSMLRKCHTLLTSIKAHKWSWPFTAPVDPIALGLPDYHNIIKQPMDLGTIEQKLLNYEYNDHTQFARDVDLVWKNCFTYNQPESDVVKMAQSLKKVFEEKYNKMIAEPSTPVERKPKPVPQATPLASPAASISADEKAKKRTKKTPTVDSRSMSFEEKKRLSDNIEKLDQDKLSRVVQIIQSRAPKASSQSNESEIEIDLDKLDAVTLRELERFVRSCMVNTKKKENKKKNAAAQQQQQQAVPAQAQAAAAVPAASTPAAQAATPAVAVQQPQAKKDDDSDSDSDDSDSDSSSDSDSGSDTEQSQPKPAADPSSAPQSLSQVSLPNESLAEPRIIMQAPPTLSKVEDTQIKLQNKWSFDDDESPVQLKQQELPNIDKSSADAKLWSEFKTMKEMQQAREKERDEKIRQEQERKRQEAEEERLRKQMQETEQKRLMEIEREKARRQREQFQEHAKSKIEEEQLNMSLMAQPSSMFDNDK